MADIMNKLNDVELLEEDQLDEVAGGIDDRLRKVLNNYSKQP